MNWSWPFFIFLHHGFGRDMLNWASVYVFPFFLNLWFSYWVWFLSKSCVNFCRSLIYLPSFPMRETWFFTWPPWIKIYLLPASWTVVLFNEGEVSLASWYIYSEMVEFVAQNISGWLFFTCLIFLYSSQFDEFSLCGEDFLM